MSRVEEAARLLLDEVARRGRPLKLTRSKVRRLTGASVNTRLLADEVIRLAGERGDVAVYVERRGDTRRVILYPRWLGSPVLDGGWVE